MGLYGAIWDYMGLYGTIWDYMGLYETNSHAHPGRMVDFSRKHAFCVSVCAVVRTCVLDHVHVHNTHLCRRQVLQLDGQVRDVHYVSV
jgi:hypothetical protein